MLSLSDLLKSILLLPQSMLLLPQTLERTRRVCPAVNVTAQAGVETVRV